MVSSSFCNNDENDFTFLFSLPLPSQGNWIWYETNDSIKEYKTRKIEQYKKEFNQINWDSLSLSQIQFYLLEQHSDLNKEFYHIEIKRFLMFWDCRKAFQYGDRKKSLPFLSGS